MTGEISPNTNQILLEFQQKSSFDSSEKNDKVVKHFSFKGKMLKILSYITQLISKHEKTACFEPTVKQISKVSSLNNQFPVCIGTGASGAAYRVENTTTVESMLEDQGLDVSKLKPVGMQDVTTDEKLKEDVTTTLVAKKIREEKYDKEKKAGVLLETLPGNPNIISTIAQSKGDKVIVYQDAGDSLGEIISLPPHQSLKMNEILFLNLLTQISKGIAYLHDNGVVHRDIKPDNITVKINTGAAKLVDIGTLAKVDSINNKLVGTIPYLPPEFLSEPHNDPEYYKSVDVYSLGVVMTEILPFLTEQGKEIISWGGMDKKDFKQLSNVDKTRRRNKVIRTVLGDLKQSKKCGYIDEKLMKRDFPQFKSKILPLILNMLTSNYRDRPSSEFIVARLQEIYKDGRSAKGYKRDDIASP